MSRRIVLAALRMAIDARRPEELLIHHSDRGGQNTSDDFRNELAKHGIDCSTSSAENCYDNAAVKSFFGLRKRERVNRIFLKRPLKPSRITYRIPDLPPYSLNDRI